MRHWPNLESRKDLWFCETGWGSVGTGGKTFNQNCQKRCSYPSLLFRHSSNTDRKKFLPCPQISTSRFDSVDPFLEGHLLSFFGLHVDHTERVHIGWHVDRMFVGWILYLDRKEGGAQCAEGDWWEWLLVWVGQISVGGKGGKATREWERMKRRQHEKCLFGNDEWLELPKESVLEVG